MSCLSVGTRLIPALPCRVCLFFTIGAGPSTIYLSSSSRVACVRQLASSDFVVMSRSAAGLCAGFGCCRR